MIYSLRITSGQEKITAEILAKKSRAESLPIYSVVYVENVKGYLFIEAADENAATKLTQKVKHVKGILKRAMTLQEIESLIKVSATMVVIIENGDIVEMISGPFKGEKAKVISSDEAKEEITVELVDVAVPIPVTVKMKMVKLLSKKNKGEETNN